MSSLRPSVLRSQIAAVRKKSPASRVIALKSRARWQDGPVLVVEEQVFQVRQCDSELAIREAMLDAEDRGTPLAVITVLGENCLSADVRARIARGRLLRLDVWDSLGELFQARKIDPRVRRYGWVIEMLAERPPEQGYRPAANGVLTAEHMWGEFLQACLGFRAAGPDARDILLWTLDVAGPAKYAQLAPEMRAEIEKWISARAGPLAAFLLECVAGGKAAMLIPAGLACEIIFGEAEGTSPALRDAAIRLEKHTIDQPVVRERGRLWAKAALDLVYDLWSDGQDREADRLREALDRLAAELGIADETWRSQISPAGFEGRMARFAQALEKYLGGSTAVDLRTLWELANECSVHASARNVSQRIERLRMACRLCGWVAAEAAIAPRSVDFSGLAQQYLDEGGFVDWARNSLYGGEGFQPLATALNALMKRVSQRRHRENREFATALARWLESGGLANDVIPIEDVLCLAVAKVAATDPVLLIVCDGMNMAVFRQLIEDIIVRHRWIEQRPAAQHWPLPVIAALPTITGVSRSSLLSGRLTTRENDDETTGFRTNGPLRQAAGGHDPLLFVKGELLADGGAELSAQLLAEMRSARRRVIGVIVNAVDDYLLKGDQVAFPWTVAHIPVLERLLFAAREANRVVLLTSDHGHVLHHESQCRPHEPGERYHTDPVPPEEDELLLEGPRVLAGQGRIVAPWSEDVRYAGKKNGYHGGISLQEVVIPLAVLTFQRDVPGWTAMPLWQPEWWTEGSCRSLSDPRPVSGPVAAAACTAPPPPPPTLLDVKAREARSRWIADLLASEVMREQKAMVGRTVLTDDRIAAFLSALEVQGGTILLPTLAQRIGQPLLRMRGIVTVMQRILNVEGYDVLSYDAAAETVVLNPDLLRKQFELP